MNAEGVSRVDEPIIRHVSQAPVCAHGDGRCVSNPLQLGRTAGNTDEIAGPRDAEARVYSSLYDSADPR